MGEVIAFPELQSGYGIELQTAVGAEYLPVPTTLPVIESCFSSQSGGYLDCDSIFDFAFARERFRRQAEEIRENGMQLLREGEFDSVLPPTDALGTARQVVIAKKEFGENSYEYNSLRQALGLDCKRLYAEAFRKNTYEYFPPVDQEFDEVTDQYVSNNIGLSVMTENGLSPIITQPEERSARVGEYVEERTYKIARTIGKKAVEHSIDFEPQPIRIRTISQCADWAIEKYEIDLASGKESLSSYDGYVPSIKKLMIRDVSFDFVGDKRQEEQLGLSGEYITPEVIAEVLANNNLDLPIDITKAELRSKQIVVDDDIFAFVEQLDLIAGKHSGKNIFMGEVVPENHPKDYKYVRTEAKLRQDKQLTDSLIIENYVMELARQDIDPFIAEKMVATFVTDHLLQIGRENPEQAAIMFDDKTANGFRKVKILEDQGRYHDANRLVENIRTEAPPASYCTGGSCGLESVNINSKDGQELTEKLDAKPGDKIVKDTVRTCKNCGERKLVYAFNSKKVHTLCEGCGVLKKK